ncbi:hypothetical protein HYV31_00605 [candidate division WWE3 bacterium]|nr:hypothetical protein [candidate division WWE3 bacterium]
MNSFKIILAIKDSLKIAYKNKILWVFALMLAGTSAGSNFNTARNLDPNKDNTKTSDKIISMTDRGRKNESKLLAVGEGITSEENKLLNDLDLVIPEKDFAQDEFEPTVNAENSGETLDVTSKNFIFMQALQILYLTPPQEYLQIFKTNLITLGFVAVVGITVAIVVGLIIHAWGYLAILVGSKDAVDGQDINLKKLSDKGMTNYLRMVRFKILMFLTFLITIFVFMIIGVAPFIFFEKNIITTLIYIPLAAIYITIFISLIYITKIGPYFITFEDSKAREAFYLGWDFFKKNFKLAILTDLASFVLVGLITCVVILFLGVLFFGGVFIYPSVVSLLQEHFALILPVSLFLSILLISVVFSFMAFTGFILTFRYILWTKLFFALKDKDNDQYRDHFPLKTDLDLTNSNKMEVTSVA